MQVVHHPDPAYADAMALHIGAHVDQEDPIAEATARGASLSQIFLGAPQSYKGPVIRYAGGAEALKADAEAPPAYRMTGPL